MPFLLCLVAALAAVPCARGSQSPGELDLHAYAQTLGRCAGEVADLRAHPEKIAAFRKSLPPAWNVHAEGKSFAVSTAWLDGALGDIESHPDKAAPAWRSITKRLEFLEAQAEALEAPAATPAASTARERIDAIFRGAEFRGMAGPGPLARWWQRVTSWVGEKIAWLVERLHLSKGTGNYIAYVLIGLVVVLLALWLWRSLADRTRGMELEFEPDALVRDSRRWMAEALAAAERGEYREAIHCGYWAAVAHLETLGAIPRDPSRTPREILRLVEKSAEERGPFGELTARFERVWYGYRAPTADDWESTKAQLERMGCLG
ncbi:MAG: DUF4129 domain-containing protein [Acidobacteriota bacterium]|nr:DUF4129 domain-containing protein [Acidobacteriota bacterium]